MSVRAGFEAAFPPPKGITWNEDLQRYTLTVGRGTNIATWKAYCLLWAEWRERKPGSGEVGADD